jgi:hypothetical protein
MWIGGGSIPETRSRHAGLLERFQVDYLQSGLSSVLSHPFREWKTQMLRLRSGAEWMGHGAFC